MVWVRMTYFHRFFRTIPGVLTDSVDNVDLVDIIDNVRDDFGANLKQYQTPVDKISKH